MIIKFKKLTKICTNVFQDGVAVAYISPSRVSYTPRQNLHVLTIGSNGYTLHIACRTKRHAKIVALRRLLEMATSMCKKHGVFAQKNLESVHFAAHAHA